MQIYSDDRCRHCSLGVETLPGILLSRSSCPTDIMGKSLLLEVIIAFCMFGSY